jgi:hypothetical protein
MRLGVEAGRRGGIAPLIAAIGYTETEYVRMQWAFNLLPAARA